MKCRSELRIDGNGMRCQQDERQWFISNEQNGTPNRRERKKKKRQKKREIEEKKEGEGKKENKLIGFFGFNGDN